MKMDVTYHPAQDRLRLCLRNDQQSTDWWLTRRLTLRLLQALLQQLERVPLPTLNQPWLPRPCCKPEVATSAKQIGTLLAILALVSAAIVASSSTH